MKTLKIRRGFTLVELMIVIVIIGILAALAVVGISKYTGAAKSAEVPDQLRAIADAAEFKANMGSKAAAGVLAEGATSETPDQNLCPSADWTPALLSGGEKYQTAQDDWDAWSCLGFKIEVPQYYSYNYTATAGTGYTTQAEADFDADGTPQIHEFGAEYHDQRWQRYPKVVQTQEE